MREGSGPAEDGGAVGGELSDGLRGEIREDGDVDGNFVVEEADAATDGGAIVAGGGIDEADSWGDVDGIGGEAVVIETDAEVENEAGMDLPTVLERRRVKSLRVAAEGREGAR